MILNWTQSSNRQEEKHFASVVIYGLRFFLIVRPVRPQGGYSLAVRQKDEIKDLAWIYYNTLDEAKARAYEWAERVRYRMGT